VASLAHIEVAGNRKSTAIPVNPSRLAVVSACGKDLSGELQEGEQLRQEAIALNLRLADSRPER